MSDVLRNFVPFLLYRVIAKGVRLASAEYADMGLSVQDARVMIALLHSPRIRVRELADLTCIEQSAVSHMLRRLSRNQLLSRERVAHDNRSVQVRLTAKGERLARRCYGLAQTHNEAMLRGVSKSETDMLRTLLRRLFDNVNQWGERDAYPIKDRAAEFPSARPTTRTS